MKYGNNYTRALSLILNHNLLKSLSNITNLTEYLDRIIQIQLTGFWDF